MSSAHPKRTDRTAEEIRQAAKRTFASAADAYVASAGHRAGTDLGRLAALATDRLGGLTGRQTLDVATGGGHVALTLARAGAHVTATDLTPRMLEAAAAFIRQEAPTLPVEFREADAGALPFGTATFDLVTCRIAAHHFPDPGAFLREVGRVLKPGGVAILIDNIAPEDRELGEAMNEVERVRDASHVECYPVSWWVSQAALTGLETLHLERFWREKAFQEWARRTPPQGVPADDHEATIEDHVRGLPRRAREYLGAATEGEPLISLRHEVMLLVLGNQGAASDRER